MLVQLLEKQRRAVNVVKTALLNVGVRGRAVSVMADSCGAYKNYAVFISSGVDEPFYETGKTIAEAVRNTLKAIKGKHSAEVFEAAAPF